jgi:hypothetical protein
MRVLHVASSLIAPSFWGLGLPFLVQLLFTASLLRFPLLRVCSFIFRYKYFIIIPLVPNSAIRHGL